MELERLSYRPERAMQILDIGRTTMYALLRSGEIESIKVGRARIIPASALQEFIERKRQEQLNAEPGA